MTERNMSNEINDEKLKEAKEKLACHIEPPKHKSESSSQTASSCSISGASADFIDENGNVLLTRMTSAGG